MRGGMVKVFQSSWLRCDSNLEDTQEAVRHSQGLDQHGQDVVSNMEGTQEAVRHSQGFVRHRQDVYSNGTSTSDALRHGKDFSIDMVKMSVRT